MSSATDRCVLPRSLSDLSTVFEPYPGADGIIIELSDGSTISCSAAGAAMIDVIPDHFLAGDDSVVSFAAPGAKNVVKLGRESFHQCANLTNVDFSGFSSLKFIGDCVLRMTSLTTFSSRGLSEVTEIGQQFLCGCHQLVAIDFSGLTSLKQFESMCASDCPLKSVLFPGVSALPTSMPHQSVHPEFALKTDPYISFIGRAGFIQCPAFKYNKQPNGKSKGVKKILKEKQKHPNLKVLPPPAVLTAYCFFHLLSKQKQRTSASLVAFLTGTNEAELLKQNPGVDFSQFARNPKPKVRLPSIVYNSCGDLVVEELQQFVNEMAKQNHTPPSVASFSPITGNTFSSPITLPSEITNPFLDNFFIAHILLMGCAAPGEMSAIYHGRIPVESVKDEIAATHRLVSKSKVQVSLGLSSQSLNFTVHGHQFPVSQVNNTALQQYMVSDGSGSVPTLKM